MTEDVTMSSTMPTNDLNDRLSKIERAQERTLVLLDTLTKKVEADIHGNDAWRDRMELLVHGDGSGHRGLMVRLDRLEQAQERAKWAIRTIGGVAAALAGKAVLGLFGG